MSWRRMPLYVQSHDLACWLSEEAARWPADASALASRVLLLAQRLLENVSLALTFPDRRARTRRTADETVVRLRVLLRVAEAQGHMTPRRLRFVAAELDSIGRMIGGWERKARQRSKVRESQGTGAGAPRPEARRARR